MFHIVMILVRQMTCHSQVKSMIVRHLIVITFAYIIHSRCAGIFVKPIGVQFVIVLLQTECSARACTVYKRCRHFPYPVYSVLHSYAQIMFSVVLGRKRLAKIDYLPFPVKLPHSPAPSITYPSRHRTDLALCKQLYAITPAIAYAHLCLPILAIHIRCSVFVLKQIDHLLVISLHR